MEDQYLLCRQAEGCLTDVCKTIENIQTQYKLLWQYRLLNPQFYILLFHNENKSVFAQDRYFIYIFIYRINLIKYEELEMNVNIF
jgi:hypothetical protein